MPPVVHPDVDEVFASHFEAQRSARRRLGLEAGAATWPKERHLERIRESGHFRFGREIVCHGWAETDAEPIVDLAESVGGPRALFGGEAPEVEETFERLREIANAILAQRSWPMVVCYRVRLGIRYIDGDAWTTGHRFLRLWTRRRALDFRPRSPLSR